MSGLWLLHGLREDGVLTTIDSEPEHQRAAKIAFRDGGVVASRTRLINGRALDVLPRLADSGYDLVFVDATPADHPHFVREGVRCSDPAGSSCCTTLCSTGASPIRPRGTRRYSLFVKPRAPSLRTNDWRRWYCRSATDCCALYA